MRICILDKDQLEAKNRELKQQIIDLETKIKEFEAKINASEHNS